MSSICKSAQIDQLRNSGYSLSIFDIRLYAVYLFTMPLGRLIIRPDGMPTTLKIMPVSTIIMLIGVLLLVRRTRFRISRRVLPFMGLYVFMVLYSVVAAVLISSFVPLFHGQLVILAPAENIVNYFITILSLYYNFTIVSKIRSFQFVARVFDASLWVVITIGYIQLGMILGVPGCGSLYDTLSSFLALVNPRRLMLAERGVTLFGSEPSSIADLFYILIPYLIVSIIYKLQNKRLHIIMLALLAVLLLGSDSSSVFIMMALCIVCTVVVIVNVYKMRWVSTAAFIGGLMIAVMYSTAEFSGQAKMDSDSIEYKLYGKVVDKSNYSTMMRSSTIAVDMRLLAEYPLTGVGMGLQGLWYEEYVPGWTKRSFEVRHLLSNNSGISNGGGAFFPMYLSGFGIIGLIVLIFVLTPYIKHVGSLKRDKPLYALYMMGMSAAILAMWYVASPKLNESICFLLVFPLAFYNRR